MKVLFVIDKLNMGGVSSSLINLLNEIHESYDCYILDFSGNQKILKKIPRNVKIISGGKTLSILGKTQKEVFKESFLLGMFRAILVMISKVISGYFARKILFLFVKDVSNFDLTISYTHDVSWNSLTTGCNQFVIEKVESKKKVSFVHCDYSRYGGYNSKQERIYNLFDNVICVSDSSKRVMEECFNSLKYKLVRIYNLTDIKKIQRLSTDFYEFNHNVINIVTVCRLSEEKGLERAIEAFYKIKKEGIDRFTFTIIGDGDRKEQLVELVKKYDLVKEITFLGEKSNPFYYMKDADLFLSSSYHEAAPMVYGECKALQLPIISTNTLSAEELVQNVNAGVVCSNSTEGLYKVLKKELETREIINNYCYDPRHVNDGAINDVYNFFRKINSDIN